MDELGFKIQSQPCNSEEEGLEVLFFFLGICCTLPACLAARFITS